MAMTVIRRALGRLNLVLAAVLALATWAVLAALATRPEFKHLADVTPQARFTVSTETRALLDELAANDAKVRIDTFFAAIPRGRTPEERALFAIPARVEQLLRDLLKRYEELGGDTVEVVHYDAYRDVEASRARVQELGGVRSAGNFMVVSIGERRRVLQLPTDVATIDNPATRVGAAPGADRALPRLVSFEGEEAISTTIRSLLVEGTPKVYVLTKDQATRSLTAGVSDSYSELLRALDTEGFDVGVHAIETEPRIPADASVVTLLEPTWRLSDRAQEALIEYVAGGGRLFLNTSWSNVEGPNFNPRFELLGQRFGFEIGDDLVCCLVPDPRAPGQPGVAGPPATSLSIASLSPHPITRPLMEIGRVPQLKSARPIRKRAEPPQDVRFEPLLRTGQWSWLAPRDGQQGAILSAPRSGEAFGPRVVGAAIDVDRGTERSGHVVLISGIAFINAGLGVNGDLALNAFNWLVERNELVTVRGNRYESRRIELTPQQFERSATLLQLWVPGVLLALGLVMFLLRRLT